MFDNNLLLSFLRNKTQIRVRLSKEAILARAKFHDEIEKQLGIGGDLHDVADIAGKATSFATKLAALFHLSKNSQSLTKTSHTHLITELSEETFLEASIVQRYFLQQATNTQRTTQHEAWLQKAKTVLDWLIVKKQKGEIETFKYADIYTKYGRRPKLTSEETAAIVELLINSGWVVKVSGESSRFTLKNHGKT